MPVEVENYDLANYQANYDLATPKFNTGASNHNQDLDNLKILLNSHPDENNIQNLAKTMITTVQKLNEIKSKEKIEGIDLELLETERN